MSDPLNHFRKMSSAPSSKEEYDAWLRADDTIALLKINIHENELVVYSGLWRRFIHGVLVPANLVDPPDTEDLLRWNCNAGSSWGISHGGDPRSIWISPPLDHTGSDTIDQGEQFVFNRFFAGRLGDKNYFELSQKFVHVSDLHFVPERNAYCRLDDRGDIDEVVRIVTFPDEGDEFGGTVITVQRRALDEYMAFLDVVMVRTFEFARFRSVTLDGWNNPTPNLIGEGDLAYRLAIQKGHASYLRGYQVVRGKVARDELVVQYSLGQSESKDYVSFIARDWKNGGEIKEISCAPDATANYFVDSPLPFEMTPAFFRPDVLLKYKADSEKYQLGDRSISCREAWHLQTYDINSAGQVHTYLVYLRSLPYEEQIYWKSFNEAPKAPLSARAIATDFKGEWNLEYDPLQSVKEFCRKLYHRQVPFWTLRSEGLFNQVHYPVTSSPDEWANELLQLDKLVVEGFEGRWLRKRAAAYGRTVNANAGSITLVEQCLVGLEFEDDHARNVVKPLRSLHSLRTKLKGHASDASATEIKKKVLSGHRTYKAHFQALCQGCDEALRTISEAFDQPPSPSAPRE